MRPLVLALLLCSPASAEYTPLPADTSDSTNQNFRSIDEEIRRLDSSVSSVTANSNTWSGANTWNGASVFNANVTVSTTIIFGSSATFSGLMMGLGSSLFVATMTMSTSDTISFAVHRASFTPAIPASVNTVTLLVIPIGFSCAAPGSAASSCTTGHTSGTPFNGTMPRTGFYLNVAIADKIAFTLTFNSGGGGSGTATWLIVALL